MAVRNFYPPWRKAAALFHSLACNHCFLNGNKRTAVIALDIFLANNERLLILTSAQVYQLAVKTAEANKELRKTDQILSELAQTITDGLVDPKLIANDAKVIELLGDERFQIIEEAASRFTAYVEMINKFVEV